MKIRIKGNTIRLRLTKTEVALLAKTGHLEEHTEFADGTFIYALQASAVINLSAAIAGSTITMFMPQVWAEEWYDNDTVGYSNTIKTKAGSELFLLLEKDFKCTDADVTEDQSDNYEHPNTVCK